MDDVASHAQLSAISAVLATARAQSAAWSLRNIAHHLLRLAAGPRAVAMRVLELGAVIACIAVIGVLVFVVPSAGNLSPAFLFAPLPFLLWGTVRFGISGACASILLLGALSTWGVLNGNGPFSEQNTVQNALSMVFLLVFTSIPLLLLAAVLEERKEVAHALSQAETLHSDVLTSLHDQLAHMSRAAVLGELSGAFAHELNQPLTSILGNAEAGMRLIAQESGNSAEICAILQDIVADDLRAAHVIQRLRDLLIKGKRQHQRVDLNATVREVLDLARSHFITRHVSVEVRSDLQAPAIAGDRVQLQQLILNLVMNACDAMADTPRGERKLTVGTRWLQESGSVEVSVADQGHGIRQQLSTRIFDPFVTTKEHGLGLGLAICSSIAHAHGGRLLAENVDTGGAVFRFIVPTI